MARRRLLLAAPLLAACASESPPPEPGPPPAAVAAPAPAPPARPRQAPGTMLLRVTKADLTTAVLPEFERQVGIKVLWLGEPRLVTLRLNQPMPWPDVLDLVCQFTKTHPTRDYQNRLVLKDGWGGSLGDGDLEALQRSGRASKATTVGGGGGGGGGAQPGWSGGAAASSSGSPSGGGNGIPQPTGAYSGGAEAGAILRGTTLRGSGGP